MRSLDDLIDAADPAWPEILGWIQAAKNEAFALPTMRSRGEAVLHQLQVTTRSPLGAIALETGGLIVDGGWVRILGSGCPEMGGDSLSTWNGSDGSDPAVPGALVIGHDAIGGFFALNSGAFESTPGRVFYFAPDSLEWEDMDRGYSDFLMFALQGDLDDFYGAHRWPGWRGRLATLPPHRVIAPLPPLWMDDDKDLTKRTLNDVPAREMLALSLDVRRQLEAGAREKGAS